MERCCDYGGKRRKTGKPCRKPAGWGIPNKTTGKCRIHGGANTGRPIEHGRFSTKHREKLHKDMEKFLNDPRPGDLQAELALMRTLLQNFVDRFPDEISLDLKSIHAMYDMIEAIGRMVERISKILNQTALTQADLRYLQIVLTDLITRFIDEPDKRIEFISELRKAFGESPQSSRRFIEGGNETN